MARLPLTVAEKKARGTREKHLDPKPRDLEEIQDDIADAIAGLSDMRENLTMAGQGIREKGMYLLSRATNNKGETVVTEKLNPAFRVQREAMAAIKTIKRALVLLREESESLAARAAAPADNDFAGLD